jgi:aspartate/tyrosine/aromatic aminotransferase
MAERIITMRALLKKELEDLGSKHDWSHITSQIGMFAYTGLTPEQMDKLAKEASTQLYGANSADKYSTPCTQPKMAEFQSQVSHPETSRD